MANRLASATSPYLQQHAENPVDWWEWGPEALAEAKRLDRPILLSVGYAACHWCHVMAHESFEDEVTAAYMNEHFVNIKVDREERPDIDAVYMQATQAMTGQGGWPMTCVLTPDGEPFFAGTYFPPEPRHGMPAFTQILQGLADAWVNRRDEVMQIGRNVAEHVRQRPRQGSGELTAEAIAEAVATLAEEYDSEAGGFGSSPKFPPSMIIEFLLRQHQLTGDQSALKMAVSTCEAMARGGIYDQLAGGFARYSVDRFWRVPHFEKMLYDNALLLRVYLHLWRQTGLPWAERIARETARFMYDELRTPEGGFASALDADSEGHEGTFYVWNLEQFRAVLGDDANWAASVLGVTAEGTFERGFSTLQRFTDLNEPVDVVRWNSVLERLREARRTRIRPHRDDKVVASWNGLAISAFAEAGVMLNDPGYLAAAAATGQLLVDVHGAGQGVMTRTSRDGQAGQSSAVLDDYGNVAEGFLTLLGVTGDAVWLDRARALLDHVEAQFLDPAGGYFDTAHESEELIARPKDLSDNATPSGHAAVADAFVKLSAITGEHKYREAADRALSAAGLLASQAPRFAGAVLSVTAAMHAGPACIAVVGEDRSDMLRAAMMAPSPGAVVIAGPTGLDVPLFEGRTPIDGQTAAYVCFDFACRAPVTSPEGLAEQF